MSDEGEKQLSPVSAPETEASHNSANENAAGPASAEADHDLKAQLCCTSVFTFLSNEVPAFYAQLNDEDLVKIKTFVAETLSPYTGQENLQLGDFLSHNALSVAAKLFRSTLESTVKDPENGKLSDDMRRLQGQQDIDILVQGWKDQRAVRGGIGVIDGRDIYGPRAPDDDDDEDVPMLAPMSFVNLDSIEAMRRVMAKKD